MAKPRNSNVVGKRVYRMGSHAPTRGTVNPVGYIKREQKKRAKKRAAQAIPFPSIKPNPQLLLSTLGVKGSSLKKKRTR